MGIHKKKKKKKKKNLNILVPSHEAMNSFSFKKKQFSDEKKNFNFFSLTVNKRKHTRFRCKKKMILLIAFLLLIGNLFFTFRQNLLHAIQLTSITCRLSCLYILFIWFTNITIPFECMQSMFITVLFFFQLLQLTTISRTLIANLFLFFFPNFIFIYLFYFRIITFYDFSTLLFFLQCMVVLFYWVCFLFDPHHEIQEVIYYIQCNPWRICNFQILSAFISHLIYNVFILYHIVYSWNLNFSYSSWKLIHIFLFLYMCMLASSYLLNRQTACNYFDPYYPCESNPLFCHSMMLSKLNLLNHFQNYLTGKWNQKKFLFYYEKSFDYKIEIAFLKVCYCILIKKILLHGFVNIIIYIVMVLFILPAIFHTNYSTQMKEKMVTQFFDFGSLQCFILQRLFLLIFLFFFFVF